MSWCPWICRPWPQHYPHMADDVTANPAIQTNRQAEEVDEPTRIARPEARGAHCGAGSARNTSELLQRPDSYRRPVP
jgi:hypothetical protein